jgi:hypothetical protein
VNAPIKLFIQASATKDKKSSVESFEGLELRNIIEFNYNGVSLKCIKANVKCELWAYTHIEKVEEITNIFEAKDMEWFWIDYGDEIGVNKSSSQITKCYKIEELIGKKVLCVVNFLQRQIENFMSEVLVIGTYSTRGGRIDSDREMS